MSNNLSAFAVFRNGCRGSAIRAVAAVFAVFLLAGCGPAGPRAVLKGERLIREQKYALAVQELQEAIRLIPTNAQAWNHLGLALHYNKQPKDAFKAYRQALALDRKLSIVHYNIGCLLLEQNDPAGAIDPLTSYTYLQPRSAAGWLKLGAAQLRARKFDAAEVSFKRVLELEPANVEAANNLGVAQALRKRPFEALASFNQALRHDSRNGAAVLNATIVTYQQLNNPGMALQKLRQSMALKPHSQVAALSSFANRLDLEVNPPKALAQASAPAPVLATSVGAAQPKALLPTNLPPRLQPPAVVTIPAPARTDATVAALPPTPVAAPPAATAVTNAAPATNKSESIAALVHNVPRRAAEIEVTRLTDDIIVTPARDVPAVHEPRPARSTPSGSTPAVPSAETKTEKKNLISRLNPFAGKSNPPEARTAASVTRDSRPTPQTATPAFPRYTYINPRRPVAGNRAEASRALAEGLKAHQSGRLSQASALYERAVQWDQAFFEAQHNLGLALLDGGNTRRALAAFETALALRPDSADARYNFALALKQANHALDAAEQLERILQAYPDDTRAHLALGNLYAQKLNQPERAREHYWRVLQKNPQHPQAAEIRLWLSARSRG